MDRNISEEFHRLVEPSLPRHTRSRVGEDVHYEIRSPLDSDEIPRRILVQVDADSDEVIVAFAGGHSHGGDWRDPEDPDHNFRETIRFIGEITDERVVGYSLPNGAGGITDVECIEDLPISAAVHSWLGRYDRTKTSERHPGTKLRRSLKAWFARVSRP